MLINEIAKLAGMSKDGIRHYEEMGLISSAPRQAGGRVYRDYDSAAVLDAIGKVRVAQRLGFSLKEIGPLIKAYAENPPTREQEIAFLEERLRGVREKLASLGEVENFLSEKLQRYRSS